MNTFYTVPLIFTNSTANKVPPSTRNQRGVNQSLRIHQRPAACGPSSFRVSTTWAPPFVFIWSACGISPPATAPSLKSPHSTPGTLPAVRGMDIAQHRSTTGQPRPVDLEPQSDITPLASCFACEFQSYLPWTHVCAISIVSIYRIYFCMLLLRLAASYQTRTSIQLSYLLDRLLVL